MKKLVALVLTLLMLLSLSGALADFNRPYLGGEDLRKYTTVQPVHGHPTADHPAKRLIQKGAIELPVLRFLFISDCCLFCDLAGAYDCVCGFESPCEHEGCLFCGEYPCCEMCGYVACDCDIYNPCSHPDCFECTDEPPVDYPCCFSCYDEDCGCDGISVTCEHSGCTYCGEGSL